MAIYDFFLSRNNGPTLSNYVGHVGRLFYDDSTGVIRISDGVTPGGTPIPITLATSTVAGAIKLGPGVELNSQGQIIIDSSGLDFSFGDFEALVGTYSDSTEYALLSSIKEDEDIVIASNGNGTVKLVGAFEVYRTNGTVTGSLEDEEPYFKIKDDGQVQILVPAEDMLEGGIEIIGSLTGTYVSPGIAGTMLHMTGNPNVPTRVYHDTLGDYSSYVFRRYNGSVASPGQVLANQDIGRINWTAATNSGMGNVATAQISVTALENQTTTAQGSKITLTVTPIGQSAANRVDVATITVANGVTATKFTGPLTGNADTATTATNLAAASNIFAGSVTIDPASVAGSASSMQTFNNFTGLTTNHKIVITSGTAFNSGLIIQAAWVSAANTVSIEFRNTTNQAIDANSTAIQYFAWV